MRSEKTRGNSEVLTWKKRWKHELSYVCVHMCRHRDRERGWEEKPQIVFLRDPRINTILVAMNPHNMQISLSKYHSPLGGIRAPWRNGWFQGQGSKRTRWACNILCQKIRKCSWNNGDKSKGHRTSTEGTPPGHIWDNWNIKIYNYSNGLYISFLGWISTNWVHLCDRYKGALWVQWKVSRARKMRVLMKIKFI